MTTRLSIAARFCGPPGTGNGGYTAGRIAAHLQPGVGEAVEVTLRAPVPLERDLDLTIGDTGVEVVADGQTVATARVVAFAIDVPDPISYDAAAAVISQPLRGFVDEHPFPGCFVCGPDRVPGDGMRLFAARVPGTANFAVPWTVGDRGTEFVWAALDCPSSFPMYLAEDPFAGPCVLGRLTAQVDRVPDVGELSVVMSWRAGIDGRKLHTASALFDRDGVAVARARATWIRVEPAASERN